MEKIIKMKKFTFWLSFFIFCSEPALAYLDPGTGSIILQALVAGVVSISVFFSSIRFKVAQFLKRIFKNKKLPK
jgi:hypothetical protein